jgi:aspartate aminotransferase-like enzyme
VDPERLDEALAGLGRPPRAVFTTQSETSTGVLCDIRALNEVVRAHDSLLPARRSP